MSSKSLDALATIIDFEMVFSSNRSTERMKPGAAILRQRPEVRAQLEKLTSDDLADIRRDDPTLFCDAAYVRKGSIAMLMRQHQLALTRYNERR